MEVLYQLSYPGGMALTSQNYARGIAVCVSAMGHRWETN